MQWLIDALHLVGAVALEPATANLAAALGAGAVVERIAAPVGRLLPRVAGILSALSSSNPPPKAKGSPSARKSRTPRKARNSEPSVQPSPVPANDNEDVKLPF